MSLKSLGTKKLESVSVYGPEDYDAEGNLIAKREVPLGDYHKGAMSQVNPTAKTARPGAVDVANIYKPDKEKVTDTKNNEDPMSEQHYVAMLSYLENRHPDQDKLLAKYVEQWKAKQAGTYDPIEDPPIYLDVLVPKVVVKITRTFTRAEYETGLVADECAKQHKRSDMNIVPVLCGKLQVLPVSDLAKGIYQDEGLQQQMNLFHKRREQDANAMMDRMEEEKNQDAIKPMEVAGAEPFDYDKTGIWSEADRAALEQKKWRERCGIKEPEPEPEAKAEPEAEPKLKVPSVSERKKKKKKRSLRSVPLRQKKK
jgi:hypothetical protein